MTTRSMSILRLLTSGSLGLGLASIALAQSPEGSGNIQDVTGVPPTSSTPPSSPPAPAPAAAPATTYSRYRYDDPPAPAPTEQASIFGGYEIATPTGSLHDYIEESSFRGFEMGGLFPATRGLHLGIYFNYHLFYEDRGITTTQLPQGGAVTARVYRYTKFWSTGVLARYYLFEPEHRIRPYAGLRLGVAFLTAAALVTDLGLYETPIGFALAPEIGFAVRLAPPLALSLSARYDYSTASSGPIDSASYLAYHFGVILSTWD